MAATASATEADVPAPIFAEDFNATGANVELVNGASLEINRQADLKNVAPVF